MGLGVNTGGAVDLESSFLETSESKKALTEENVGRVRRIFFGRISNDKERLYGGARQNSRVRYIVGAAYGCLKKTQKSQKLSLLPEVR